MILFTEPNSLDCSEADRILQSDNRQYEVRQVNSDIEKAKLTDKWNVLGLPLLVTTTGALIGGIDQIRSRFPKVPEFTGNGEEVMHVELCRPNAIAPTYGSACSAGMDLYMHSCMSTNDTRASYPQVSLHAGERRLFHTGIKIHLPSSELYGRIAPRSGLADDWGIDVLAGVIDSDYKGEIGVILLNTGSTSVILSHGDRIAQLIIERCTRPDINVLDDANTIQRNVTGRGSGGFGSTGT